LDLSPEGERFVELVEEFDKQMKDKYGDGGDSETDSGAPKKPLDIEPKIMGLSLKNTPQAVKFLYLLAIFAILGLGVYIAMGKLFKPDIDIVKQKKVEKQERKKSKGKKEWFCSVIWYINTFWYLLLFVFDFVRMLMTNEHFQTQ